MATMYHTVRPGENLANIAKTYYGTEDAWAFIFRHNRHELASPNDVPVGFELVLPQVPGKIEFAPC